MGVGRVVGSEGMVLVNYDQHALWPEDKFDDPAAAATDPWIPSSNGHHKEWLEACKHGSEPSCNFDYAGALTECVLLGSVAFRAKGNLHWKPEEMFIPNAPEAEAYLRREYRQGWKH